MANIHENETSKKPFKMIYILFRDHSFNDVRKKIDMFQE